MAVEIAGFSLPVRIHFQAYYGAFSISDFSNTQAPRNPFLASQRRLPKSKSLAASNSPISSSTNSAPATTFFGNESDHDPPSGSLVGRLRPHLQPFRRAEIPASRQERRRLGEPPGSDHLIIADAFAMYDSNGDGFVTEVEYVASGGTPENFRKVNKSGSGQISLEEAQTSPMVFNTFVRVLRRSRYKQGRPSHLGGIPELSPIARRRSSLRKPASHHPATLCKIVNSVPST